MGLWNGGKGGEGPLFGNLENSGLACPIDCSLQGAVSSSDNDSEKSEFRSSFSVG